jgi:molybdopterin-guanine dinucleotide biosynthesis protein A
VTGGAEIAQARSNGRRHPVFAIWPVSMAADLRTALVEEGLRKIDDFTARYDCAIVDFGGDADAGLDPFTNLNTPEDLEMARQHLG